MNILNYLINFHMIGSGAVNCFSQLQTILQGVHSYILVQVYRYISRIKILNWHVWAKGYVH